MIPTTITLAVLFFAVCVVYLACVLINAVRDLQPRNTETTARGEAGIDIEA